MPISLDDISRRNLVLVRQLYLFALEQSSMTRVGFRAILAVIGYDLAVESAIRTAISALNTSVRTDVETTFPKLLQHADDETNKAGLGPLPDQARMKHVHHIRNDAQHNGRFPSDTELSDCRTYVRDFLEKFLPQIWGVNPEELRVSDLIQDDHARRFMQGAEDSLGRANYQRCVEFANAALSITLLNARRSLFPRSRCKLEEGLGLVNWRFDRGHPWPEVQLDTGLWKVLADQEKETERRFNDVNEKVSDLRKEVKAEFDDVEEIVLNALLGMNLSDYLLFKTLAGTVRFHREGDELKFFVNNIRAEIDTQDAENALSYCSGVLLNVESRIAP